MVCVFNVLCFDLTIIGECKKKFPKSLYKSRQTSQQFVRVVGGLWVRLGKIKCGVFVSASALAIHLF